MGFGGLGRDEGFNLVLTSELFNWFLSREEGQLWVEEYLTKLSWTAFSGGKSSAPTHFGEWFFGVSTFKVTWKGSRAGENVAFKDHPIWEAAKNLASGSDFVDHLLDGFRPNTTSEKVYYSSIGKAVLQTNWWKNNKKAFRKEIKQLMVVSEIQAS